MKRFLLAIALAAPLASCSKKDGPAPAPSAQTSLLVGTWEYKTARIQTSYDANPRQNTDVTNALANRQQVYAADGTMASVAQGYRSPGTYTLSGTTLTSNGSYVEQVAELTAARLVLVNTSEVGPGVRKVTTSTYAR